MKHTQEEDERTKFRLFKLMIRLDSIAKKLMDNSEHEMDIDEHIKFIEMNEKGFCNELERKL